jgi:hypothetical protein
MGLPATYSNQGSHFTQPGGNMSDGLTGSGAAPAEQAGSAEPSGAEAASLETAAE